MEDDILKFKRSEKLGEIIIAVFVVALFIIIQLPITPTPNKPIIYISAVLYMLFAFICLAYYLVLMALLMIGKLPMNSLKF